MERPSLTLGIEEEYLLVDPETRDLVAEPAPDFFDACRDRLGKRVSPELLQCQIEVGTQACATVDEAVAELRGLRQTVAGVASDHGYRVIAASAHPFGRWRQQAHTDKERYETLWEAMGQPGRRMVICGMHIHAGVEDPEQRITLMNQVSQLLPLMLALSASSPFWQGGDTDMASYRLAVYGELPRTGPPDRMPSFHAYEALIADLVERAVRRLGGEAEALGCRAELAGLGRIAAEGSSATRQRVVMAAALADGANRQEALRAVVDSLIGEFLGEAPESRHPAAGRDDEAGCGDPSDRRGSPAREDAAGSRTDDPAA